MRTVANNMADADSKDCSDAYLVGKGFGPAVKDIESVH